MKIMVTTRQLLAGVLFTISPLLCCAQSQSNPPSTGGLPARGHRAATVPKPVPLDHLYLHLFFYQHHLEDAAAAHEAHGEDGAWLRNHLAMQLKLTPAQFAALSASSSYVANQIKQINIKAAKELEVLRATHRAARIPFTQGAVHTPAIDSLIHQRDEILKTEIVRLKSQFGDQKASELDNFLNTQFAKNVVGSELPQRTAQMRPLNDLHARPILKPTQRLDWGLTR